AHWGFPKGHIEAGESEKETAVRETKEETGLDIDIIDGFSCKSEYTIQGKVEKAVVIFLAKARNNNVVKQEEEIDEFIWVDFNAAMRMLKFENDRNILIKAKEYIEKNNI
ncbi:MAG: bis(5'-nucleosyl)-tetraphosphatase, partial [Acutalibacteraceae bacterium]